MDYNYFISNPLKINILNKSLEIEKTYIILGDITDKIYKSILVVDKKELNSFYGPQWENKLNIKLFDSIGGDIDIEKEYSDIFNDDDIFELDFANVKINDDALTDSRDKKNIIQNVNKKTEYIRGVSIYPFDSMYIIKKKILSFTGIQIYEQHFMTPITYDILINNDVYGHYYNFETTINGIPYDQYLYDSRYSTSLKIYDNNKNINYINEINMFNLSTFLDNKLLLYRTIKNEREIQDIIYNSFVYKYFPMISLDMFINILLDEEPDNYKREKDILYILNMDKNILDEFSKFDHTERNKYINDTYNTNINSLNYSYIYNFDNNYKSLDLLELFNKSEISKINKLECIYLNLFSLSHSHSSIKINKNIPISDRVLMEIKKIKSDHANNYISFLYDDTNIKVYENLNIDIEWDTSLKLYDESKLKNLVFQKLKKHVSELSIDISDKELIIECININIINYTITSIIPINRSILNLYKESFNKFIQIGWFSTIEKSLISFTYAIHRCLYNYPANDTYTYIDSLPLTNTNSKNLDITTKYNIFTLTTSSIYHNESKLFLEFIYNILYYIRTDLVKSIVNKSNKKLSHIDPVLYGYKSEDTYTRVCQKKYQPKALTKELYDKLDKKDKVNVVKYPNITTGEQLYYKCPKEYPYMKFLKNYHPDGYCLPCCIKKEISIYKNYIDIHKECIKSTIYPQDAMVDVDNKKYIISYTTSLNTDTNRIIELPSILNTLNIYLDENKYYLTLINDSHISVLYVLSNLLDIEPTRLLAEIISLFKSDPNIFDILFNANEVEYFNTVDDFIILLNSLYNINTILSGDINWNNIFIKISSLFNIQFIILHENNGINLDTFEFIKGYHYSILLKNNNNYYSLYLYDKYLNIKTKLFADELDYEDNYVVRYLGKIMKSSVEIHNINILFSYEDLLEYSKKFNIKIKNYYNSLGECYAIGLENNITCPIQIKVQYRSKKINIYPKQNPTYKDVLKFIKTYNKHQYSLIKDSINEIYLRETKYKNRTNMIYVEEKYHKFIRIKKFIVNETHIIGLLIDTGIIYIEPIKTIKFPEYPISILDKTEDLMIREFIVDSSSVKYYGMRYRFEELNKNILKYSEPFKHEEYLEYSYERYGYKLFLSQVVEYYNNIKEDDIYHSNNYNKILEYIIGKYELIENKDITDLIIKCISFKSFDNIELFLFKFMDEDKIKSILKNISGRIFIYGKIKITDLSIDTCRNTKKNNSPFCKNNKMVMDSNLVNKYIDLFAIDIKNPFKYDMINNFYDINRTTRYKTFPNEFVSILN